MIAHTNIVIFSIIFQETLYSEETKNLVALWYFHHNIYLFQFLSSLKDCKPSHKQRQQNVGDHCHPYLFYTFCFIYSFPWKAVEESKAHHHCLKIDAIWSTLTDVIYFFGCVWMFTLSFILHFASVFNDFRYCTTIYIPLPTAIVLEDNQTVHFFVSLFLLMFCSFELS